MNGYVNTESDQAPENTAQSYMRIGQVYYGQGKLTESIAALQYALSLDPINPLVHYNLATALDAVGRIEDAISHYRQTLEIAPDMLLAYNNLGVSLHKNGNHKLAKKIFIHVIERDAHDAEDYIQQSTASYNLGRTRKAVKLYIMALNKDAAVAANYSDLHYALSQEKYYENALNKSAKVRARKSEPIKLKQGIKLFSGIRPAQAALGVGMIATAAVPAVLAIMPVNPVNQWMTAVSVGATNVQMPLAPVPAQVRFAAIAPTPAPIQRAAPSPSGSSVSQNASAPQQKASSSQKSPSSGWEDTWSSDSKDKYNIHAGPVGIDISASTELEYNDNISSSGLKKNSDIIARLKIDFDTELQLSKNIKLGMVLGMSYQKYFDNSQLDSQRHFINMGDDTGLSFDARLGSVKIHIFDNVGFSIDATDAAVVDANGAPDYEVEKFGRFTNKAGGKVSWEGKQIRLTGGLERTDVLPTEDEFEFSRSTDYNVPLTLDYKVAKDKIATLNVAYLKRENKKGGGFEQNDSTGYLVEPSLEWIPSKTLSVKVSTGFKDLSFDNPNASAVNEDKSDSNSLLLGAEIKHKLSKRFSHSLSLDKDARYGLATNTEDVLSGKYNFNWQAMKNVAVKGSLTLEHGEGSGSLGQEYDRYIANVGLRYNLTKKASISCDYFHTDKDASDRNGPSNASSFEQNRFLLGLKYDF